MRTFYLFREFGSDSAYFGATNEVDEVFDRFQDVHSRKCYKVACIDMPDGFNFMSVFKGMVNGRFIKGTDSEILDKLAKEAPQIGQVMDEILNSGLDLKTVLQVAKSMKKKEEKNPNREAIIEYVTKCMKGYFRSGEIIKALESAGIFTNKHELCRVLNSIGKKSFIKSIDGINIRAYLF